MSEVRSLRALRDEATRRAIVDALQSHSSVRAAARALAISDATLLYHMRKLGISATRSLNVAP